jgi:hypothetical protein
VDVNRYWSGEGVAETIAEFGEVAFVDVEGFGRGGTVGGRRRLDGAGAFGLDEFGAEDVTAWFIGGAAVDDTAGGADVAAADGGAEGEAGIEGECDGEVETDAVTGEVAEVAVDGLATVDEFDEDGNFAGGGGARVAAAVFGGFDLAEIAGEGGEMLEVAEVAVVCR